MIFIIAIKKHIYRIFPPDTSVCNCSKHYWYITTIFNSYLQHYKHIPGVLSGHSSGKHMQSSAPQRADPLATLPCNIWTTYLTQHWWGSFSSPVYASAVPHVQIRTSSTPSHFHTYHSVGTCKWLNVETWNVIKFQSLKYLMQLIFHSRSRYAVSYIEFKLTYLLIHIYPIIDKLLFFGDLSFLNIGDLSVKSEQLGSINVFTEWFM